MDLTLWATFTLTMTLFAITPGPAVLLVVSQAMSRGFRTGMSAALGIQAGNAVYFLISVAGLGAALAASPFAFYGIRYAGAAYLVYLGVRTLLAAKHALTLEQRPKPPLWRGAFVQGFAKQLANPKSILFFGSLLPQFIHPGPRAGLQFAVYGISCIVVEVPVLAVYAWLGVAGGRVSSSPRALVWRERLSGIALIGIGAVLATMRPQA
ncbi:MULTISPECIES: LysE family translocator [Myxococcus]|uniref:LysE family translocator n=1 Tax=Myxococcus llanfairpwllgwyngyllgogerychwyrndrobwllllantysiliogogogochensis TaxID=2590453 RepID=A0A540X7W6_9BACT|nr:MULTISPECIES: LysE family translocator [Myxococcus]NTX00919.1 LysE family translocator [Myxococcus sp. CA040A]NTX33395.1 LysE family translocator [Myxococcus sp. CA033]NTX56155.1 LysE family translocator [Myxococcus sp. CA039A]TQF17268.1 LysE family translocator [Myxococcus llanfairpwllgwyngyllgogerychwyrndrobwllllantysiliogogogochensis]